MGSHPRRLPYVVASLFTAAATVLLTAPALDAQPSYGYEVASIRRAAPDQTNSGFSPGPQGGIRAFNITPLLALTFAYKAQDTQFDNLPAWAKSERFEITYTPDRSELTIGSDTPREAREGWLDRQRLRMRAVLRDRFCLELREETRELPGYVLTVAKGGHKLTPAANPDRVQTMNINNGRALIATTAPMKALAEVLGMILKHPVRDDTGLAGAFDFQVQWTPDSTMAASTPGVAPDETKPSIFTALTEKLGLKLESRKAPVTVYVVEKLEHPSEN